MSGKHYEEKLLQSIQQANALTLFRMTFFRALHGWEGAKKAPPPPNLSHISYNDETLHSYTLPKKDPKMYDPRDTPLEFC